MSGRINYAVGNDGGRLWRKKREIERERKERDEGKKG